MAEQVAQDARQRRLRRRLRRGGLTVINDNSARPLAPQNRHFFATLDKPLLAIVLLLLIIGSLMVFSSTFDWSNEDFGSPSAFFVRQHLRNVVLGSGAMIILAVVDYRFWKRFAIWLLLFTALALIAVVLREDNILFGARRSFLGGSFQPGELAEFAIIFYLAAWLSSQRTRVASLAFGLLPFLMVVGLIVYLIVLQPDYSSAAIVVLTATVIYFVAGANILHLGAIAALAAGGALVVIQNQAWVGLRIADYFASLNDLTAANYHTSQAIAAFLRGGWFGVGIGQSQQKFGALPAPHTDSIFAIIGEELGVFGAAVVVALYIAFAIRGFQLVRRAKDSFGSLLCFGFTCWVITRALLNIAVMTNAAPSTGVPLPFISYGGSSLLVVMAGLGLMLSVHRVATKRKSGAERRSDIANFDRSGRHRRTRLSRPGHRPGPAERGP